MAKKKNIKLTEHISYCIIDSTIYLFQNNINLSEEEIEILYKKLALIIEDNGIGFNEIPDFNNQAPSSEESGTSKGHTHVGLRNLNRRLILMYGPECALHIESTPMVKTAISFKIPCEK